MDCSREYDNITPKPPEIYVIWVTLFYLLIIKKFIKSLL